MCPYDRERTDDWGLNLTTAIYLEPLGGGGSFSFARASFELPYRFHRVGKLLA